MPTVQEQALIDVLNLVTVKIGEPLVYSDNRPRWETNTVAWVEVEVINTSETVLRDVIVNLRIEDELKAPIAIVPYMLPGNLPVGGGQWSWAELPPEPAEPETRYAFWVRFESRGWKADAHIYASIEAVLVPRIPHINSRDVTIT